MSSNLIVAALKEIGAKASSLQVLAEKIEQNGELPDLINELMCDTSQLGDMVLIFLRTMHGQVGIPRTAEDAQAMACTIKDEWSYCLFARDWPVQGFASMEEAQKATKKMGVGIEFMFCDRAKLFDKHHGDTYFAHNIFRGVYVNRAVGFDGEIRATKK